MSDSFNEEFITAMADLMLEESYLAPKFDKEYSAEEIAEFYHSAYYFYQNGKYQEAEDYFRTLTALESRNVHYWMGLASALKMQRNYEKALNIYIVAGMLNHQDPLIHAHAADCCFALGQTERGLQAIDLAIILASKKEEKELATRLAVVKQAWSKQNLLECDKEAL